MWLNTSLIKSILENLLILFIVGIFMIGIVEVGNIDVDVPIIDELEEVSVLWINFTSTMLSSYEWLL